MTAVGFEPTHPKIVELESTALDRSAKLSMRPALIHTILYNNGGLKRISPFTVPE